MKIRLYLVGVSIIALLIAILWWIGKSKLIESMPLINTANANSTSNSTSSGTLTQSGNSSSTSPNASNAAILSKLAIFQEVWSAANGKSLDFYGKVIDQNNQPVIEAKVTGNVMTTLGFQGTGETPHETQTDKDGDFEFLGLHGESLGIVPEKDGYLFEQRGNGNWTDNYKADSNNRVIFTMWKLKGAEPMVHVHLHDYIACDGTVMNYNLQTGRRLPNGGGDLTVQLTRNPINIVRGNPFDWSVTLEMSNGGLIQTSDIYPDKAPAQGYQPSITIDMPVSASNWSPSLSDSYYFYNGSNYGRISIRIMADFQPPPTLFDADIYLNPSGSQNLEFDENRQINQ